MGNLWHNTGKLRCWAGATGEIDLINDAAVKCMAWEVLTGIDTDDEFIGDLSSATDVSSTGYTSGFAGAGRKALASKALTVDQANDRAEFDCADITWSSITRASSETWVALSIMKAITNDAQSPLIAFIDTGTGFPLTPNGSDITLTIDAEGLLQIT